MPLSDERPPIASTSPIASSPFARHADHRRASPSANTAVFVGAEAGAFASQGRRRRSARSNLQAGGILCAASATASASFTGGGDEKVVVLEASGETGHQWLTDAKRRWIDNVALHAGGSVRMVGRQDRDFVTTPKGDPQGHCEVPSTVGGLAFAPKVFASRSRITTA